MKCLSLSSVIVNVILSDPNGIVHSGTPKIISIRFQFDSVCDSVCISRCISAYMHLYIEMHTLAYSNKLWSNRTSKGRISWEPESIRITNRDALGPIVSSPESDHSAVHTRCRVLLLLICAAFHLFFNLVIPTVYNYKPPIL